MSVYIIAEAGVNHNGSLDLAMQLIDAAKAAGADCVKFQTFRAEALVSKTAGKAAYQIANTHNDGSQRSMLESLQLSDQDFAALKAYCEKMRIGFLSSAFDLRSLAFLRALGCTPWKIPSGEITNLPYLIAVAEMHEPVLLSTGMSDLSEVRAAVDALTEHGSGDITLLHCTTEYPAPYADVNLNAMLTLKREFGLPVGYSDHTEGIEIAIAAAALGATVIEKHFTLDRGMEGPDHKASLEPDGLKAMVEGVRRVETAMGDGAKQPSAGEIENAAAARKSIVAKTHIRAGEPLTSENITAKRPGTGISPMRWFELLGTKAVRDFAEDERIEL